MVLSFVFINIYKTVHPASCDLNISIGYVLLYSIIAGRKLGSIQVAIFFFAFTFIQTIPSWVHHLVYLSIEFVEYWRYYPCWSPLQIAVVVFVAVLYSGTESFIRDTIYATVAEVLLACTAYVHPYNQSEKWAKLRLTHANKFLTMRLSEFDRAYSSSCFVADIYLYLASVGQSDFIFNFIDAAIKLNGCDISHFKIFFKRLKKIEYVPLVTQSLLFRKTSFDKIKIEGFTLSDIFNALTFYNYSRQPDIIFKWVEHKLKHKPIEIEIEDDLKRFIKRNGFEENIDNGKIAKLNKEKFLKKPLDDILDILPLFECRFVSDNICDSREFYEILKTNDTAPWVNRIRKEIEKVLSEYIFTQKIELAAYLEQRISRVMPFSEFIRHYKTCRDARENITRDAFPSVINLNNENHSIEFYDFWYDVVIYCRKYITPSHDQIMYYEPSTTDPVIIDQIFSETITYIEGVYHNETVSTLIKPCATLALPAYCSMSVASMLRHGLNFLKDGKHGLFNKRYFLILTIFMFSTPRFYYIPEFHLSYIAFGKEIIRRYFNEELEFYLYQILPASEELNPSLYDLGVKITKDIKCSELKLRLGEVNDKWATDIRNVLSTITLPGKIPELRCLLFEHQAKVEKFLL
jgi:hypothetical protein